MPGLFDPQGGGILGGLGNYFAGVRDRMDPQGAMLRYQQELFAAQMQEQMAKNPQMPIAQALFNVQHPEIQYGLPQYGPPIEGEGGMKVPTGYYHGQPFVGIPPGPNAPQPNGQTTAPQNAGGTNQPAATPGIGGPATAGVPSALQAAQPYFDYFRNQKAQTGAAVKAAEETATAQPDLPVLQNRAADVRRKLLEIRNDPNLSEVVGGPLGVKGRTGPLGENQAALVNKIEDANNALQGDLFTTMRTISTGRPPSPGAMKEMRITDLQKLRTTNLAHFQEGIDSTIKQIENEYGAAWQARGAPDAYKPNWASATAAQASLPKPTSDHIRALKSAPERAAEFDSKFGQGAAMRVLGH